MVLLVCTWDVVFIEELCNRVPLHLLHIQHGTFSNTPRQDLGKEVDCVLKLVTSRNNERLFNQPDRISIDVWEKSSAVFFPYLFQVVTSDTTHFHLLDTHRNACRTPVLYLALANVLQSSLELIGVLVLTKRVCQSLV